MSDYTYEYDRKNTVFETYEWDNLWIERATTPEATRVLYIGDSISCGTRRIATMRTNEKILFDGFGTSKAVDNPYFIDSVKIFAAQEERRDAVLFNNGLHGWHLCDETEYAVYYEKMVRFLMESFCDTPVFLVLTTHVSNEVRDKRVVARNKIALEIAGKYNLHVIDLYSVTLENSSLLSNDGVHFVQEGYELIADTIIGEISSKRGI